MSNSAYSRLLGFLPLFSLAILAVWPLSWFQPGSLVGYVDYFPFQDYSSAFLETLHVWSSMSGSGSYYPNIISGIPIFFFGALMGKMGLPITAIEKIFLLSATLTAAFSMYGLARYLGTNALAAVAAAAIYLINPISQYYYWNVGSGKFYLIFGFAPLMLLLFFHAIDKRENWFPYVVLLNILGVMVFNANHTLIIMVFYLLMMVYYFSYKISTHQSLEWGKIAAMMGLFLLLNGYWLYFTLFGYTDIIKNTSSFTGGSNNKDFLQPFINSSIPIFDILRMTRPIPESVGQQWWPASENYIRSISAYAASMLLVLLLISGIATLLSQGFRAHPRRGHFLVIAAFSGVICFLVWGAYNPIYASLYMFLIDVSPEFGRATQNLTTKLMIYFPLFYCLLLALGVDRLLKNSGVLRKAGVVLVGSSLLIVSSWTFFTGSFIFERKGFLSYHISVPDDYSRAKQFFPDHGIESTWKSIPFPFPFTSYLTFVWGKKNNYIPHPDRMLLDIPSIVGTFSNELIYTWRDLIGDKTSLKILPFLGVRYVVLHKDVWWSFLKFQYPSRPNSWDDIQDYRKIMWEQSWDTVFRNDALEVLEIPQEQSMGLFYTPGELLLIQRAGWSNSGRNAESDALEQAIEAEKRRAASEGRLPQSNATVSAPR